MLKFLEQNELFINLKKYICMTSSLMFLRYVISANSIKVDEEKVWAIKYTWGV